MIRIFGTLNWSPELNWPPRRCAPIDNRRMMRSAVESAELLHVGHITLIGGLVQANAVRFIALSHKKGL